MTTDQKPPGAGYVHGHYVAPKRIIICCDGTWQSSVSNLKNIPSNITRLTRSIARSGKDKNGETWQQLVFYDAGIGSGEVSRDEKDLQGGFGIGFVSNVIEAYNFIVLNYNLGDEIFCFGFSRGAYTARAVAGLVTDIGIADPKDMQDFPDLYAIYQKHHDGFNFRKSSAYRKWVNAAPSRNVPEASRVIQAIGVFDTVGSLGIPDLPWTKLNLKFLDKVWGVDPGFHNVSLSPFIKHAFHALALDEHRAPFTPTPWHFPLDKEQCPEKPAESLDSLKTRWEKTLSKGNASEEELSAAWGALIDAQIYEQLGKVYGHDESDDKPHGHSDLQQVWFPGVHINIGGGDDDALNDKKGDFEQIALLSFAWMCEQISPYIQLVDDGAFNVLPEKTVHDRNKIIREASQKDEEFGLDTVVKSAKGLLNPVGILKKTSKEISEDVKKGWATGPIVDSFSGAMLLGGSITRTPGQYKDQDGKEAGATNEMIHPSVQFRLEKVRGYKPKGLAGFHRVKKMDSGRCLGYEWRKGSITIPEYLIKPEDKFTRHLAHHDRDRADDRAWKFIGEIDRAVGADTEEARKI